MRLALYQPDIAQNAGTMLRLAACFAIGVDIVEPCGFAFDERRFRRAGMDYIDRVMLRRHSSWTAFMREDRPRRLVLLTTRADAIHTAFTFRADDTLMVGQEGAGVPQDVHDAADARIRVPMASGLRSLNVAVAAAVVLGEALRQTDGFPHTP
jgi:tRNA (cytidine/uridine-2'-O-)-methyltransferase